MPIYKGSTNQGLIYYGSPNTNCLTSVPKNVKLELTYGAWTQPIFSSNTNGGLTLSASHESGPAWYAFNGDKTTNDNCWWTNHGVTSTSNPCWIQLKSTIKLKLNQVVIRNEHNTPENFKTAYLQVSNDGSSWTNVVTISGTNTGGYETTVNFTVSDGYYYYRLYFTESYSSGGVSIQTITFSGIAQNILTLKAGSKVYVPNGFESDGTTPKFDEFITTNDTVDADFGNKSREVAFLMTKSASANKFSVWPNSIVVSGTSAPDFSGSSYWGVWYDTANNIIKIQNGTNEWKTEYGFSLPICLVSSSSSAVTSLDQIFDWCGFIGSTAFVLPGVKGLIPNGFNADGTYKSIEFTTDRVLTTTRTWDISASFIQKVFFYNRGTGLGIQSRQIESESMPTVNDWAVWYNPKENIQRWNNSSNTLTDISQWAVDTTMRYVGEIPSDGTSKITSLTPATVQPLSTVRPIAKVFKGATLVFGKEVFEQTFTASGSITFPATMYRLTVIVVGAGGGGGAGSAFTTSAWWSGGGAGGGAKAESTFTGDAVKAYAGKTVSFTVGAGGGGGGFNDSSMSRGGTGGQSRFGDLVANGGVGGQNNWGGSGATGGAGGSSSGGQTNTPGNSGTNGGAFYANGAGGASLWNGYGKGGNGAYHPSGETGTAGCVYIRYEY